ncbi:MAG TPA: C1 family peptidase [Rhizomicrobium sp.]|jgi:C1A family cysteine protease|nr:C1 family peptidase [Rhizomicrobium sp.]
MELNHGTGWIPDVPKPNDYCERHPDVVALLRKTKLLARVDAAAAAPPPSINLREWFSPVEDQGKLGSCTACAAVGLLEYFERRTKKSFVNASPLFLYKVTRNLMNRTGDTGATQRATMEALALFGTPPESYWPYDGAPPETNVHFDAEPTAFQYALAKNYQALTYFRLDPDATTPAQVLNNVKAYLAGGFPVMFGFPAYTDFVTPLSDAQSKGLVAFPGPQSTYKGGHAIVAAGYDDARMIGNDQGALLVRNSWGEDWGDAGYGWMSYRYVTEGYADDWWTMISARWVDTNAFA